MGKVFWIVIWIHATVTVPIFFLNRASPKVWRFSSRADFGVRREVISDFVEKRQTRKSRQSLTVKDAARENARLWDRLYITHVISGHPLPERLIRQRRALVPYSQDDEVGSTALFASL
jgi:hypothetical protein